MLTKLIVRNFKLFKEIEIELGARVVLIGPNNSGKTSALQAIALWDLGVKRWLEKRAGRVPSERVGVAINRKDIVAIPVPAANLLWRDLHVREVERENGRQRTRNVRVEIEIEGVHESRTWRCSMEFDYANEESIYCRPAMGAGEQRSPVPEHLRELQVAYLPPMSGLAAREDKLEMGSIRVRLGEGRTAEVLRNLCWQVVEQRGEEHWQSITETMERLFGSKLERPQYAAERGEITLSYRTRAGTLLDISASGRGEQQTLLLLAHMAVHPGAVLLLDEPDAHLEILRQRQIYNVLSEQAEKTSSQIIAASHSEVLLNEAAQRDIVIAFVGKPHRIGGSGSQVLKALRDIGFEDYYLAEETGWVLYLEGATDLEILRAFARVLSHPAQSVLERPFVRYVGNQPTKAQEHFYALREAKPDLKGVALFDHIDRGLPTDPVLKLYMWSKREIENYLCSKETLLRFAEHEATRRWGIVGAHHWRETMENAIREVQEALNTLGKDPWSGEIKASEEFLEPLFAQFYKKLGLPNMMRKTHFHLLASFVPQEEIDPEVRSKLDAICEVAEQCRA